MKHTFSELDNQINLKSTHILGFFITLQLNSFSKGFKTRFPGDLVMGNTACNSCRQSCL